MILKQIIFFAFISLIYAHPGFSQGPPPPPPPPPALIYSSPSLDELAEFTPSDGSFTVTFPGKPTESIRTEGQLTTTTYEVHRKGSSSTVMISAFPIDITDRTNGAFSSIRNGFLERERTKIVAERDVELEGVIGREFEVDFGLQYGIIRVYIAGTKMMMIMCDVTNWSILSEKVKEEWRKEADRFFSSFAITK